MNFLESVEEESLYKFNTIRNNTLQDTGSKWFGLEFFKHQVARLIDEYHLEIFSFAAYTLL